MCRIEVLYCIVLYLYIYIALLEVHTNQKRFQCERPREKRAVLRERKEALGSPVNKVDRVEGRSWFQIELCADVIVSAAARRSISVGGGRAAPRRKKRRGRGGGGA